MSTLIGFYLGLHDSNIAVARDGKVQYAKSERIYGIKHHHADLSFIKQMCSQWGITEVDAICFSDGNRNDLGMCSENQLWCEVGPIEGLPQAAATFCIDHHYAHILSSWPLQDVDKAALGIAIDGRGDHNIRRCVITSPGSTRAQCIYRDRSMTIGPLFEAIGRLMGITTNDRDVEVAVDIAGKVMGAQGYGSIDEAYVSSIPFHEIRTNPERLITKVPWQGTIPLAKKQFFSFDDRSFRDWLASINSVLERDMCDFFNQYADPHNVTIYSGGCAQNVSVNERLFRTFPHLIVPPHCYDGGLSLGALELMRMICGEPKFSNEGFPYWQEDIQTRFPSEGQIQKAVESLAKGDIVGWFQGRGEIGPRALGNRSILMSPSLADGKDILNRRIKHREPWRPFGASMLLRAAPQWLVGSPESPYMLRAVPLRSSIRDLVPAVAHVDGTCRVQTVTSMQNSLLYELLERFEKLTSVPVLLNTSLNGGGQPIFSRIEQCQQFAKLVDIDMMVIGDSVA